MASLSVRPEVLEGEESNLSDNFLFFFIKENSLSIEYQSNKKDLNVRSRMHFLQSYRKKDSS